jgi:oligopeptidase A
MDRDHPFLDDRFYVRWSRLTPEHVVPDITAALAEAGANIDAVAGTDRGKMDFASTLLALEDATERLSRAWGLVGHLDAVCNSAPLREAHNAVLPKVSEFFAKIPLNEGLWDLLKTYAATPGAAALTGVEKRFLDETLADFRERGADLPAARKARLEAIEAELAAATQKFSENVLDSTNAWELVVDDEAKLSGLPPTARAAALEDARAKGLGSEGRPAWRFTLHLPSYLPLMEHLDDRDLRRAAWRGNCTVGLGGTYDNTDLVRKILSLRQEKADLLDRPHFADAVLERRMAKSGEAALAFTHDLFARVKPAFDREAIELREFRADSLGEKATLLEPWDTAYWAEKRRKARYDFDDEDLRPYFPIDGVIGGMFDIAQTVFDIEIRLRETVFAEPGSAPAEGHVPPEKGGPVEVWHPEVKFYEVFNKVGTHLGSFYADWHPREPKRGGAWMNYLITGRPPSGDDDRRPHLGLICGNLTPPAAGRPALLTHHEVETVFHEFGHLLHHLLGEVPVRSLNGVNVAWDFVELPSQLMENFCWERASLDRFARHYQTGKPIPAKLFRRMTAARNFMSATATMRQLAFAKLDLELHMHHAGGSGQDLDGLAAEILEGYLVPLKTRPPTIARRFTHLFGSPTGYAAGYYSYKWAEVLDADAFTRFRSDGVLSAAVGREFRDKILARGNSAPPDQLFRDFMGRPPDLTALLVRSGLG